MCVSLQEELCGRGAGAVAAGTVCVCAVQDNGSQDLAGAAGTGHPALR